MDIAIVTGASSSLGLAVSRRLIQLGFRVYGLGGEYKDCPLQNVNFKPMPCDLDDAAAVEAACGKILEKEKGVYVLVNNAKFFGRSRFQDMELPEMQRILSINLLCPLVLIRKLSQSLKELQGYVIQLGAPYSESCRGGAAGAAASGGLKWMGEMVFHELRDYGVKVCHISPEPNRSRDPRSVAHPAARTEASIDPDAVAQAVEQILQNPFGNVVTELVMRPVRTREPQQEPVRKLPYPDPQPIPYTVPREMIEAEEQLEEEEWRKGQEEKRQRRRARKDARKQDSQEKSVPAEAKPEGTSTDKPDPARPEVAPDKLRRKARRKPKPSRQEVGFLKKEEKAAQPESTGEPKESKEPKKADSTRQAPAKKAARKRAPAKKSARKRAPRKSAGSADNPDREKSGKDSAGETPPARKRPRKRAAKKAAKKSESGKDSA